MNDHLLRIQRCCPVSETNTLKNCPVCSSPSTGLLLLPLSFDDIDRALEEAAKTNLSNKRGKKRQNATVTRLNPRIKTAANDISAGDESTTSTGESSDLRTGRWTAEEIAYCDKLIDHFSSGSLPIPEKIKLNDFLANMLKSKQSRLTKKMKNARFSAKQYVRKIGHTMSADEAREFSQLETDFFASVKCNMEVSLYFLDQMSDAYFYFVSTKFIFSVRKFGFICKKFGVNYSARFAFRLDRKWIWIHGLRV